MERLSIELPQWLLAANLEGVPTQFAQVLFAPEAAEFEPVLRGMFQCPVASFALPKPPFATALDLSPLPWQAEARRLRRSRKMRPRIALAVAFYLFLVVAALIHLSLLHRQSVQLADELARLRPRLELRQARETRATALSAAIDPRRYTVELLYLLQRQIPNPGLRLTEFDQSSQEWRIVGEAPSATAALDYLNRIKRDADLEDWQVSAGPPQLLVNERAQFNISGKP